MEYNNPFGRGRSRFSENMKKNLAAFTKYLQSHDIHFACRDFTKTDLSRFGPQDFIYCDPPYLITTGSYNDGRRGFQGWGEAEEEKLYHLLDRANAKHLRFALSNVLEHKGRVNRLLLEWSRKYHVIELNADYSNASYNTKRSQSREVLIINY
jgi:adenine-specific DNA-methyltransferase